MDKIAKLKQISIDMNVASLREATLSLLLDIIDKNDIKSVLEIGTGVGYSAYMMHTHKPTLKIDTIEFSDDRYATACEMLKGINEISCHHTDCFQFTSDKQYDLILVDGPKRNQDKLIEHLMQFTNDHTIFFIDNMDLRKIRDIKEKTNNQKHIIASLDEFKKYLLVHPTYEFVYHALDDGVMIGKRKWN